MPRLASLLPVALAVVSLALVHCEDSEALGGAAGAGGADGRAGGAAGAGSSEGPGGAGAGASQAGMSGSSGQGGAAGSFAAPYELVPLDKARITSDPGQPNFQHVSAPFELTGGPFAEVRVEVSLGTTCYPFESWKTNPPPEGQNFPADCDAFDRNFETILDEPVQDGDRPGLEVIRAITPFGGPLTVSADLTDLANLRPGDHTVHVRIPTWSDGEGKVSGSAGGWNVTVRIKATPGVAPRKVLAVEPLINLTQETGVAPVVATWEVPAGTAQARIEYRATGHGGGEPTTGCVGPAEEFCKRSHELQIDDGPPRHETPWRIDCKTLCQLTHYGPADGGFDYCLENPTGAVSSVKAPRANWCPGHETAPFLIEDEALRAAGTHTFTYAIPKQAPGGVWRLSAFYVAYGE